MIKITNGVVVELMVVGQEYRALKGPVPVIVRRAWDKGFEHLQKHYLALEKAKTTICEEHADKDKAGKPIIAKNKAYQFSEENKLVVNTKIQHLLAQEVEMPDYRISAANLPFDFSFSNDDFPHNGLFISYIFKD